MISAGVRHRQGFTLTETAMAIGIVSIAIIGIWVVAGQVSTSNKTQKTIQELLAIVNNIRSINMEQGGVTNNAANALTQALDQLKAFPLDMRQNQALATGVVFHPWSQRTFGALGNVQIDADNCNGAADATGAPQPCFGVTFSDVPQNACIQLITQTSQGSTGLMYLSVNGAVAGSVALNSLPIPASTVETICTNGNGIGTNNILWEYAVHVGGT